MQYIAEIGYKIISNGKCYDNSIGCDTMVQDKQIDNPDYRKFRKYDICNTTISK